MKSTFETVIERLGEYYEVSDTGGGAYLIERASYGSGKPSFSAEVGQIAGFIQDEWGGRALEDFHVEDWTESALREGFIDQEEAEDRKEPSTLLRLATPEDKRREPQRLEELTRAWEQLHEVTP